jgi:hypothetical protein
MFKRGFIWQVGNEECIDIWSDPWIPLSPDRKITMPRGAVVYTKVHELLNPYTGTWDEDLLRVLFNAVDVERILQIPINHQGFEDFIAWGETKHGRYMVKSGYYLQWKHQFGTSFSQLALPGGSATNLTWKVLWKLKIPSKVKIFMWRALHGIMPLKFWQIAILEIVVLVLYVTKVQKMFVIYLCLSNGEI